MRLLIEQLSFRYNSQNISLFEDLSIFADSGKLIVLTGKSGSGKSTLLRLIAGLLAPSTGSIMIEGKSVSDLSSSERIKSVGFVSQKPSEQILCQKVGQELAFAMESACVQPKDMHRTVEVLLQESELGVSLNHSTAALSGGEIQRLMTSACRAASAQLLLLDEPFAHLDRKSSLKLLNVLSSFCQSGGTAIVVEHRLDFLLHSAHVLWFLKQGQIDILEPHLIQPKTVVFQKLLEAGLSLNRGHVSEHLDVQPKLDLKEYTKICWQGKNINYRYPKTLNTQLSLENMLIYKGEVLFVLGKNGAGKSTLLKLLSGEIKWGGKSPDSAILVPQDPDLNLFCESVRAELSFPHKESSIDELIHAFDLVDLVEKVPQSLSKGQRLRVAIAASVSNRPELLMLDEPTAGQEGRQVWKTLFALREYFSGSLLVVTHEVDLAMALASRIIILDKGKCVAQGRPKDIYPTLKRLGLSTPWVDSCIEQYGYVFDPLEHFYA